MNLQTKYALITFTIILIIIMLSKFTGKTKKSNIIGSSSVNLRTVADKTNKYWNLAKQDQNPIISLIHVTLASGSLDTLTSFMSHDALEKDYSIDVMDMRKKMTKLNKEIMAEINSSTKMSVPNNLL